MAAEPLVVSPANLAEAFALRADGGWRPLAHYLNDLVPAQALLSDGYGLLLRGPRSFISAAAPLLADRGVKAQIFEGTGSRGTFQVLELGRSYVVAEHFEFEPIAHAA